MPAEIGQVLRTTRESWSTTSSGSEPMHFLASAPIGL
jgi:hypothetical protein